MYRLFIVEDDRHIAQGLEELARAWGLECRAAQDLRAVMEEFRAFDPHLVLLDIGLPFFDGYHWCAQIRRESRAPILFLSSAADNMNIVMAMNMGADDFIAKPFDGAVLMAKIQALLRRAYDFSLPSPVLEHRGARLDTGSGTLTYRGETIPLTKNEYHLLLCLMEERGRIVSRQRLMERLWRTRQFIDENTLTVNVNRLRRKLDAAGLGGFITTRVGQGYIVE